MALIIGRAAILALALGTLSASADPGDQGATVRRIAATAALAAEEYRLGVRDGKVVAPAEVEEARLFLTEARRTAGLLPLDSGPATIADIDTLIALVSRSAPPDSVSTRVRQLGAGLAARYGVSLEEIPERYFAFLAEM
jgi:hypothetical protein